MGAYLTRLTNVLGIKFIALICITQCCLKGINFVIMSKGLLPYFSTVLGIDGVRLQVYGAVGLSPWTIKPLIGIFSDLVSCVGYHKRFMMLFATLVGITGSALLISEIHIPVLMVVFVACAHFQIAVCDLLIEGKYAEVMRENPESGSDIPNFATGLQFLGVLISMLFLGPLSDLGLFRVIFAISLALAVTPVLPVLFGWLPEQPKPGAPYVQLDTKRIRQDWKIIAVVAVTGISAPAVASITVFGIKWLGVMCAGIVISLCLVGVFWAMPHPLIARVALYQVLAQVSRISFSNILDFFFIADPVCLPGGPHFSYKFYITVAGIVGACAGVLTTLIYQGLFSKWTFRNVLFFTSLLSGLAGIFDYIIVKRWNLIIGIPDNIFFLIGDDVLGTVVGTLYWIPSSSIIGKVCPRNMEASTYALLAGIANFGTMIATLTGAMLAEMFGVVTIGQCNWDNLPSLILFGHIIVMLTISLPAAFLIPNVSQDLNLLTYTETPKEDVSFAYFKKPLALPIPTDDENSDDDDIF